MADRIARPGLRSTSVRVLAVAAVATCAMMLLFLLLPDEQNIAPRAEGWCAQSGEAERHGLTNESCTYIASQVPVLPRNTENAARVDAFNSSTELRPGSAVPNSVKELQPLPASVTESLPQLRGFRYFLSGQNIVLVDPQSKIALTIDVRLRPERTS